MKIVMALRYVCVSINQFGLVEVQASPSIYTTNMTYEGEVFFFIEI